MLIVSKNTPLRDSILKQVEALHEKLEEDEDRKKNVTYHIEEIRRVKELKKDAIKSLAISLGLIVVPISIGALLYKPMFKTENYNTVVEEYSINDRLNTHDEVMSLVNETGEETLILEYEPWEEYRDGFTRDYREYDVSHIDYDDLAQYLLLDLQRLGINYTENREYKDALAPEDLYTDNEYVVVSYTQDLDNPIISYDFSDSNDSVLWVFIVAILTIPCGIHGFGNLLMSIDDLKDYLNKNKELKENLGYDLKELLNKHAEANRKIKKIKKELVAFYDKYKFLLEKKKYREDYQELTRER